MIVFSISSLVEGTQRIVNFHGQHDQYNLCQFLRIRKTDFSGADSLTDNLCQYRLQFCDDMVDVFLVQERFFSGVRPAWFSDLRNSAEEVWQAWKIMAILVKGEISV